LLRAGQPLFAYRDFRWKTGSERLKNDSSQANCFSQKIDIKNDSAYFEAV